MNLIPLLAETNVFPSPDLLNILAVIAAIFVCVVLLMVCIAVIIALYKRLFPNSGTSNQQTSNNPRTSLAFIVVLVSIIGVVLLAAIGILNAANKTTATTQIMSTVLPLLGTWVGTIMAFYFGRENYESAAKNTVIATEKGSNIAGGVNREDILASKKVTDTMLKFDDNTFSISLAKGARADAFSAQKLTKMLDDLDTAAKARNQKWSRIPILDDQGHPVFVVHRSTIDAFRNKKTAADAAAIKAVADAAAKAAGVTSAAAADVAKAAADTAAKVAVDTPAKSAAAKAAADAAAKAAGVTSAAAADVAKAAADAAAPEPTLLDLYQDPDYTNVLIESIAVLPESANLKDATLPMNNKNCQDVIITKNGGRDEEALGWITNEDIQKAVNA